MLPTLVDGCYLPLKDEARSEGSPAQPQAAAPKPGLTYGGLYYLQLSEVFRTGDAVSRTVSGGNCNW